MKYFAPDVILEEGIFVPRNIGPDCDTIGHLLYDYGEKFILSALEDGDYTLSSIWDKFIPHIRSGVNIPEHTHPV